MKIIKKFGFVAIIFFAILIMSCNKSEVLSSTDPLSDDDSSALKQNEATWVSSEDSKRPWWLLKLTVGHTVQQCGGKCIKIFGEYGHIDCVGFGNVCNHFVKVSIENGVGEIYFNLKASDPNALGSLLEFPFPDRSLMITNPQNNTDLWLNIPEQLLIRNNNQEPFIFYDAWHSENAEFENL
jgi:hypothetical protein